MKLFDVINNWTTTEILIGWFVAFLLHRKFNAPYMIKRLFKWSVVKYRKFPDCYSCFTFWTTLLLTFSPTAAIGAYLIAVIIETIEK